MLLFAVIPCVHFSSSLLQRLPCMQVPLEAEQDQELLFLQDHNSDQHPSHWGLHMPGMGPTSYWPRIDPRSRAAEVTQSMSLEAAMEKNQGVGHSSGTQQMPLCWSFGCSWVLCMLQWERASWAAKTGNSMTQVRLELHTEDTQNRFGSVSIIKLKKDNLGVVIPLWSKQSWAQNLKLSMLLAALHWANFQQAAGQKWKTHLRMERRLSKFADNNWQTMRGMHLCCFNPQCLTNSLKEVACLLGSASISLLKWLTCREYKFYKN